MTEGLYPASERQAGPTDLGSERCGQEQSRAEQSGAERSTRGDDAGAGLSRVVRTQACARLPTSAPSLS